ncbi:MAG: hypothetical protein AAFX06_09760, partial [Planctomycetota bacterium]
RSEDLSYSVFNGIGALCILFSIYFAFNLSALIIETIWVLISIIGVVRYLRNRGDIDQSSEE